MTDKHLSELMQQCASVTPLGRLGSTEQEVVFNWLLDGGHMTRTGKPLERLRPAPIVVARKPVSAPIYAPDADFSTHARSPRSSVFRKSRSTP